MAIPIAVTIPLIVVVTVIADRHHGSEGALGSVVLGLMGIMVVVGSFMALRDLGK